MLLLVRKEGKKRARNVELISSFMLLIKIFYFVTANGG